MVQSIIRSILYGARLIDNMTLVAINKIGSEQAHSTTNTLNAYAWLLDYIATYPNPLITLKKSDMMLAVVSNSSFLSVSKSRSRVGGYHFLSNITNPKIPLGNQVIFCKVLIYIKASILKNIMCMVGKIKIATTFINTKLAIPKRICLLEIGYPQLATLFVINNTIAYDILTK